MGDEDQRAAVVHERVQQHFLGVEVEVVGGLVEDQEVARVQEHLGEGQPVALAARQHAHPLVDVVAAEEEAAEDVADHRHHLHGAGRAHLLVDGVGRVEHGRLVLGEVVGDHLVPGDADARVGPVYAGQDPHQRRLAGAVGADERDAVAALHHQVHVLEHDVLGVRSPHALQLEEDAAGPGRVGELETDLLALGRDLDQLDLVEHLDAALDLAGLGGLVAELVDEEGGLLDLFLLPPVRLPQAVHARLVLHDVVRVVAVIVGERSQAHLGDAQDGGVEEVAVVGDEHDRPRVVVQVLLEPVARREVQVVGRLVHEEQVGPGEQELGQRDPHLPAPRELLGAALLVGEREAEALEDVGDAGVDLVAAEVLEPLGDLGVALEQLLVLAAVVVRRRCQAVFDLVLLLLEGDQLLERQHHLVMDDAPLVDEAVLGQVADGRVGGHPDGAGVGLLEAC